MNHDRRKREPYHICTSRYPLVAWQNKADNHQLRMKWANADTSTFRDHFQMKKMVIQGRGRFELTFRLPKFKRLRPQQRCMCFSKGWCHTFGSFWTYSSIWQCCYCSDFYNYIMYMFSSQNWSPHGLADIRPPGLTTEEVHMKKGYLHRYF